LHPTPAVCGFPKLDAKQFILENENYNRQYYTGFLGELNFKNRRTRNTNRRNVENSAYGSFRLESDLFVNLRCMQIIKNEAHIYVGGGVTRDSTPEKEWEETTNKAATMMDVLIHSSDFTLNG
ncbi:MAG: chorismate-binding protein, partial [Bacteroidota bacterium]